MLGAVIVMASLVWRTRHALLVSAILVTTFGALTIDRNRVWSDEVSLWLDAARKAPEKLRPHLNLGWLYQMRGDADRAMNEYQFVLARQPEHPARYRT